MVSWTNETLQGAKGFTKLAIATEEVLVPAFIGLFLGVVLILFIKYYAKEQGREQRE